MVMAEEIENKKPEAIDRKALQEEQAGPTVTGVRSVVPSFNITGITPPQMASIMRAADQGDAMAYLDMAEQIEEKDSHYSAVLGTRKRAVCQMEITVSPASDDPIDKENAKLVERMIDREDLQEELFDILDGIGKGFSVTEVIWSTNKNLWMPDRLEWRDQRWFDLDRSDVRTPRLRTENGAIDLMPYKYIVHTHKAKSGLPIRGGVARPVAWMWLFKNFSVKDWVVFAEAYGQPLRIGKYGPGSTPEDRAVLLRAIQNIGSDFGAIVPEGMTIEFIESQGKTSSTDMFERLCRWADEQISKAVLGQTTTTDAIGGGLAGNQSHGDVRDDIAESDAAQLSATLNRQLVRPLIDLNKGPQANYPRLSIGRSERVDIEKESLVADRMARAGGRVSRKKIMDRLGLPTADSDDDVLTPLPSAPAPGFAASELASALRVKPKPRDAVDDLAERMAEDFEEDIDPLAAAMEQAALEAGGDWEKFEEALLKIAVELNVEKQAQRIARSVMAARLAGNAGEKLK
jgi:phage gp29-like protein